MLESLPALGVGKVDERAAVEVEQVEDQVGDGAVGHPAPHGGRRSEVHAALKALEAGPAVLVEGDDLAIEHRLPGAERAAERAQLGVVRGDLAKVAALQSQLAALAVGDRAYAVPLELVCPSVLVGRQAGGEGGEHRLQLARHGLPLGVERGVHAVDHPVVAVGLEDRVPALHPLPGEGGDHLVVAELLGLVRAPVPDLDRPRSVLALRDLALEPEVLERMILGADGQSVLLRVLGDALRERPGRQGAVALEPQVPVQATRVVLVDDEAVALRALRLPAGAWLRGLLERPLLLVLAELLRHATPW